MLAWRTIAKVAPFTHMFIGDIDSKRAHACVSRLNVLGAPATAYVGPAEETVIQMVQAVPSSGSLCMAYVDPYNLELLSFAIIREIAKLKVDLAVNFSTMDLERNCELQFDAARPRFDSTAPGWRGIPMSWAPADRMWLQHFLSVGSIVFRRLGFSTVRRCPSCSMITGGRYIGWYFLLVMHCLHVFGVT